MPKRRNFECVYCGGNENPSRDHLPPRNLFPEDRRINLITVPSCEGCNNGRSDDDEYLRLMLLQQGMESHPAAAQLLPVVERSLKRPEAQKLSTTIIQNIQRVYVYKAPGIYLGRQYQYELDASRINDVASRIIKGLFYYETGARLADRYEASAVLGEGTRQPNGELPWQTQQLVRVLASCPTKTIGKDVFSYRYKLTSDDPNGSAWWLVFYNRVHFLGLTAQPPPQYLVIR